MFRKKYPGISFLPVVIIFILFELSSLSGYSQLLQTIDLREVPQKKVRKYIIAREINQMQNFTLIKPSWKKGTDESSFRVNEKTFYLKDKLSHAWNCYRESSPTKTWSGHFVRFALLLTKNPNSIVYFNTSIFPEIDTGQIYFLDLRLLRGLFNIPMAFEIINVDPVKRIMEFSYIDGNKSAGKQTIQFFDNHDGRIKIIHKSYFKSDSPLRDHLLYPYFHKKFINEFHRNMRHEVLALRIP